MAGRSALGKEEGLFENFSVKNGIVGIVDAKARKANYFVGYANF